MKRILIATVCIAVVSGCQSADRPEARLSGARLYAGLDHYHRPINTGSPAAQQWFDQGLQLLYGFNHDEAIRSFHEAARHDPESPMTWWGIAYAWGMNINRPVMSDDRWQAAWQAVQEAQRRAVGADPVEASLVGAVTARYSWPPPAEQRTLDTAYAVAMGAVWERYPNDPDIAVLYAESLMNLQPWDYWTNEAEPKGRIEKVVAVLEATLGEYPDHPGATHFYIHAVEAAYP